MKKKVYIYTFRKGENQGTCIPVTQAELWVHGERMPVIGYNGCISGEIARRRLVHYVMILGREFVIRTDANGNLKLPFGSEPMANGADCEVAIPFDLAEKLKERLCPHCNKVVLGLNPGILDGSA